MCIAVKITHDDSKFTIKTKKKILKRWRNERKAYFCEEERKSLKVEIKERRRRLESIKVLEIGSDTKHGTRTTGVGVVALAAWLFAVGNVLISIYFGKKIGEVWICDTCEQGSLCSQLSINRISITTKNLVHTAF